MSGFVGIVRFDGAPIDNDTFEAMLDRIEYRGFDGVGRFITDQVAFGHRLFKSTTESANEQQPFTIGEHTIVADAILYNRDDLLHDLRRPDLRSAPDVELILHAYLQWGSDCLQHLIGGFAFAIWDAAEQRLFIACDQFGKRTLYYYHSASILVFSTELMAIRLCPDVPITPSELAVADYLLFGSVYRFDKSQTIFQDIYRIPPAHYVKINVQQSMMQRYWQVDEKIKTLFYKDQRDYAEHLDALLHECFRMSLRGKTMVFHISGGIDSSLMARFAYELDLLKNINFMTIVRRDQHPDVEGFYARIVAETVGKETHLFEADIYNLVLHQMVYAEPRPIVSDRESLDQLRFARNLGSVIVNGSGGDELHRQSTMYDVFSHLGIAGFIWFYLQMWQGTGQRPLFTGFADAWRQIQRRQQKSKITYHYPAWIVNDLTKKYELHQRWEQFWQMKVASEHPIQSKISYSVQWPTWATTSEFIERLPFTPPDIVMPYLNPKLIEFMVSIPPVNLLHKKKISRLLLENTFPPTITQRPKTPLGVLVYSQANHSQTGWLRDWQPQSEVGRYVDIDKLLPLSSQEYRYFRAQMNVVTFDHWLRYFSI